jgi:hypothetical protein
MKFISESIKGCKGALPLNNLSQRIQINFLVIYSHQTLICLVRDDEHLTNQNKESDPRATFTIKQTKSFSLRIRSQYAIIDKRKI